MGVARPTRFVRFGSFQLDLRAGELRRNGVKLRVPDQSIQVLAMLLDHPGDVVTRRELHQKLWPNGTIVEFDHSLNAAINRLRQALEDSPEEPRFIETLPRRGYRFIHSVQQVASTETAAPSAPEPEIGGLAGQRISHYRILRKLGHGAMGVVYQAEDTRLGRSVAIKFLPEELSDDPQALERFQHEARAASALNHPNICTVHEVGEHEDVPFIVMEYVTGKSLEQFIGAEGLPEDKVLGYAVQVSDALVRAHSAGIVHRDLKPANIMVNQDGLVKLLDFGLAKLMEPSSSEFSQTKTLRTEENSSSELGTLVGTVAYMSPEQTLGDELDARTDLFSFGVVLYEMITGARPFTGDTSTALFDAILHKAPVSPVQLNPATPGKLEEIINKALEKDRDLRYQHAADIRTDLKRLKRDSVSGRPSAGQQVSGVPAREEHNDFPKPGYPTLKGGARRSAPPLLVAGVFAVLLAAGAVFWFTKRPSSSSSSLAELKQRQLTTNSTENAVGSGAISPDGKYLVYADPKGIHLKLIDINSVETRAIPQPETLKGRPSDWWITWFPDSTRLLATDRYESGQRSSIWMISVIGGAPRKLRDEAFAWSVSPDGSKVAFTTNQGRFGDREIWLMGPDGEQARKLCEVGENGALWRVEWSPDGQRVAYAKFQAAPGKFESAFETRDLKGGPPITLSNWDNRVPTDFLWLPDGRMIYTGGEPGSCNFWEARIDARRGKLQTPSRLTNWAGFCMDGATATADGKRVAFRKWSYDTATYVAGLEANGTRITKPGRLTQSEDASPMTWTSDSKAVIFQSLRNGRYEIFKHLMNSDTAEPIVITGSESAAVISPDGVWVLYPVYPKEGGISAPVQIKRVPMAGGPSQLVLTAHDFVGYRCARAPAMLCAIAERAPDGKQLIFTAFDLVKGRGRELIRFDTDPHASDFRSAQYYWDLSPDGSRVALVKPSQGLLHILSLSDQAPQEIVVKGWSLAEVNWAADGKGLFVTSPMPQGSVLLHVDLQGNAHVLWELKGNLDTWGAASPDGRHLAMLGITINSNIWMIENF